MISKKHHFGLKKKKVFRKNAQKKFVDKNQRALVVIKQPKEENSSFWKTKWGKKIIEVCVCVFFFFYNVCRFIYFMIRLPYAIL